MTAVGLARHVRETFRPHLSLLYSDEHFEARSIAPIAWRVSQLVLLDSWVGESTHAELGCWPLASSQPGFDFR